MIKSEFERRERQGARSFVERSDRTNPLPYFAYGERDKLTTTANNGQIYGLVEACGTGSSL